MVDNACFDNFPIDYFQLKEEYFRNNSGESDFEFSIEELPVVNGYLTNQLADYIDFNRNETVVVNCAVGHGKTSGVLNAIKNYLNEEDSEMIFTIAVPLVSLVQQYKQDLIELGFTSEQIYVYDQIDNEIPEFGEEYRGFHCRFHIVTVNTLLGNPGEYAVMQSERKYRYIRAFAEHLLAHNRRLCIIYDEIHEAIANFTEEGFIYLNHFSPNITKNIILSATFNVQSVAVIKMLAGISMFKKIRVLETVRVVEKPQSNLFLHYDNTYPDNLKTLNGIIGNAITAAKKIDILCSSKKLAKKIIDSNTEAGNMLKQHFKVRDCTSGIENNQGNNDEDLMQNRFDNDFCNVGTNFKSGVSIQKEKHCYIVILPARNARTTYTAFNGIFTEGANAVIQALARQRVVGDIHIILPKPLSMDYDTLVNLNREQKDSFINFYEKISDNPSEIDTTNNVTIERNKFITFNQQYDLVKEFYNKYLDRIEMPLYLNRNLKAPNFDKYLLTTGGKIISNHKFLGLDLASFVSYSAFTNQFFNAKLTSFNVINNRISREDLFTLIKQRYDDLDSSLNPSEKYNQIVRSLEYTLSPAQQREADKYIINLILEKEPNIRHLTDIEISVEKRFIISYFNNFLSENPHNLERKLKNFINLAEKNIFTHRNKKYFTKYEDSKVFEGKITEINSLISELRKITPLNKKTFDFFRHTPGQTSGQIEKRFYKFIISLQYKTTSEQITIDGIKRRYIYIVKTFNDLHN